MNIAAMWTIVTEVLVTMALMLILVAEGMDRSDRDFSYDGADFGCGRDG